MLFAQLENVPAESLKNFVLIVTGIVVMIYYIKEIIGGKKKREVSFETESASKTEFDLQKKHCTERHSQLFQRIETLEKDTPSQIQKNIEVVRRDVVLVGKDVSALQAQTELQNQTLASVTTDIKTILQRLPRRHE